MKSTAVTENLTQLTRMMGINAFLVREDDGFTMIDTMIKGSGKGLVGAAVPTGLPIVRVVVTHAHDDHIGAVDEVAKALPEAELLVPKRDVLPCKGDTSNQPGEPDGRWLRGPKPFKAEITRELVEGDRIGSLEVIDAPGHSPGQIALLDTRDDCLIAADAFTNLFGAVATTAGPDWHFPLPGFATWHKPTALKSAIKLRDLEPSLLVVGHGKPAKNPVPAMTAAIEKRS